MPCWAVHQRFTRYPIQLPVLYWPKGPARPRAGAGWTRDLSEEGATVELAEGLQAQTLLRVRVQTDRGPIEVEAKVAWAGESAPTGKAFLHGLAFTQVASNQLQALRDLLLPLSMAPHAGVRLPLDLAVTCQPKSPGGPPFRGRTGELSRGGLMLRLPLALASGTMLEVTLHTGKGPVTLEGAIVWVRAPERWMPGEPIAHGLQFTSPCRSISLALGFLLTELL